MLEVVVEVIEGDHEGDHGDNDDTTIMAWSCHQQAAGFKVSLGWGNLSSPKPSKALT